MTIQEQIAQFMTSPVYGVVGASSNRQKFGNKVLRCYIQNNKNVFPINPNESEIEGIPTVATVSNLPNEVQSISIITPPLVTLRVVAEAIEHGIKNIWMQPGAEDSEAIKLCHAHNINLIADGSCLLVLLGFHEY